jgi:hypothetical protein
MQYFIQQLKQLFYAQVEKLNTKNSTMSSISTQPTSYQTRKQVFCLGILSGEPCQVQCYNFIVVSIFEASVLLKYFFMTFILFFFLSSTSVLCDQPTHELNYFLVYDIQWLCSVLKILATAVIEPEQHYFYLRVADYNTFCTWRPYCGLHLSDRGEHHALNLRQDLPPFTSRTRIVSTIPPILSSLVMEAVPRTLCITYRIRLANRIYKSCM